MSIKNHQIVNTETDLVNFMTANETLTIDINKNISPMPIAREYAECKFLIEKELFDRMLKQKKLVSLKFNRYGLKGGNADKVQKKKIGVTLMKKLRKHINDNVLNCVHNFFDIDISEDNVRVTMHEHIEHANICYSRDLDNLLDFLHENHVIRLAVKTVYLGIRDGRFTIECSR